MPTRVSLGKRFKGPAAPGSGIAARSSLEGTSVFNSGGRICIYDFPSAPFDKLADAARTPSVLNGRPPKRTPIRTGVPFLRCVRYFMSF
jgi:hypothetical protein